MARYIDAEALIKQMKNSKYVDGETPFQLCVNAVVDYWISEIKYFPSTNVVPKSEVERLRFNLEAVLEEIPETKSEVAMEIFEEMQSCLIQRHWNGLDIVSFEFDAVKYAELKMKYTENKGE